MRRRSSRTKEVTREKQGVMPTSTLDRKAEEIASQWEEQYDPSQFAPLAMAILLKAQKKLKTDMTAGIRKSYLFKRKVLPAVHAARDWTIHKHVKEARAAIASASGKRLTVPAFIDTDPAL